jgi:hypothetical protein
LAPRRDIVRGAKVFVHAITQLRSDHCIAASENRLAPRQFIPQIVPSRDAGKVAGQSRRSPMRILLLAPFVGLLWVPFYNFQEPALFGFPFFYWYQLAWVPITSVLIWLVHRARPRDDAP